MHLVHPAPTPPVSCARSLQQWVLLRRDASRASRMESLRLGQQSSTTEIGTLLTKKPDVVIEGETREVEVHSTLVGTQR